MAALTVYDMVKGVERGVEIRGIRLVSKTGGKSGEWHRPADRRRGAAAAAASGRGERVAGRIGKKKPRMTGRRDARRTLARSSSRAATERGRRRARTRREPRSRSA